MSYRDIDIDALPSYVKDLLEEILEREGSGYVNYKWDHPTKYGIRQVTADIAGYTGELKHMDKTTASQIWIKLFWFDPKLSIVDGLSRLVAKTMFDTAGPAGHKVAIIHLQKALTSFNAISGGSYIFGPDLKFDGIIGSNTIAQLEKYLSRRPDHLLANRLNCLQDAHFTDVAIRKPDKRAASIGWTKQRVFADLQELVDSA